MGERQGFERVVVPARAQQRRPVMGRGTFHTFCPVIQKMPLGESEMHMMCPMNGLQGQEKPADASLSM
jgi:hypothetical protein